MHEELDARSNDTGSDMVLRNKHGEWICVLHIDASVTHAASELSPCTLR